MKRYIKTYNKVVPDFLAIVGPYKYREGNGHVPATCKICCTPADSSDMMGTTENLPICWGCIKEETPGATR